MDKHNDLSNVGRFNNNHKSNGWMRATLILAILAGLCIMAAAKEDPAEKLIKDGYKLKWSGSLEEANKSFERALEIYNENLMANPGDLNALENWSLVLLNLGRVEEAVSTLDEATENDSNNPSAWCNKGFTLITIAERYPIDAANMYNKSLQAFQRALDLDPDNAEAWRGQALVYSYLGAQDKALAALDRAIELNPLYGQAWLDKGNLLLNTGRAEESLQALNRALMTDPDNLEALSAKAEALSILGRYDESAAAFDRAMGTDSGDFESSMGNGNGDWL
jgi:tetratricopeptide (TPR) repeat protein